MSKVNQVPIARWNWMFVRWTIRRAHQEGLFEFHGGRDTPTLGLDQSLSVSSCCVPEFDPEGFRITMNRERGSIIHDCYWLGYSPVTQLFEKLRQKRSELVKLHEQATLINSAGGNSTGSPDSNSNRVSVC